MLKLTVAAAIAVLIVSILATVPAGAIMLVSRSQEVQIGKQVEASMIQQYGGLSTDSALNARVANIGRRVAAYSPRKDVTYTYKVVNSDVINAFSAPGGPVVVTQRLARMMNDPELAFVLGHETGHIAAEHGRKAINNALVASGVLSLLFRNSSDVTRTGINIMYTLYDRGYSRTQEYEADTYGVRLMRAAGYNVEGGVTALAKLGLQRSSGINKYFASHPDTPDRIDRVARLAGISPQREQALVRQVQSG